MPKRTRNALAAVLAFACSTALASAASGRPLPAATPPAWGRCPAGVDSLARTTAGRVVTLQCATLRVPLDYRRPAGRTITVAVSRLRSTNPGARRGVLLLDPGGPGDPGLGYPLELAQMAPQRLLDAYDLVGFDPRGVGHSTPVTCGLSFEQAIKATAPWPLPGGVAENARVARTVARQCTARSGALLPFVTTANTARDMDRIRAALGEQRVSYYGVSYGSYLGAVYASLFPRRTDRGVLDSVTEPNHVWRESGFRVAGPGVELRFPDFARFAADHDATYHLGTTVAQVRARYFALAAGLDRRPLATPSGKLTGNLFRTVTLESMFGDQAFPPTAQLWRAVQEGDARTAGALGDLFGLWDAAGFDAATENTVAANLAVICDDASWPRSVSRYEHDVRHDSRRYPIAGALAADIWPCAFWPNQPLEPPVKAGRHGPHNLLLVNNLRDPATPYSGAVATRHDFGDRGRLVAVDQGGHGVYLVNPNACANSTVTRWLVDGTMPARDTVCPEDPDTARTKAASRMAPAVRSSPFPR